MLSPKKIVAKEFKVDFKGYNAEEVDHFLDLIVKDYESFAAMLNASYDKIDQLEARLSEQKIKIAKLEREKHYKTIIFMQWKRIFQLMWIF